MLMARPQIRGFGGRSERTRDRAGALALTLVVYALLVALVLVFGRTSPAVMKVEDRLTAILLTPPKPKPPVKQKVRPSRKFANHVGVEPKRKPSPAPPLLPDLPAPAIIPPIVDLPKLAFAEAGPASAATGPSSQAGSGNGQGDAGFGRGGGGGGGGILYNAVLEQGMDMNDLQRRIRGPVPAIGWGMIACRTIPDNRVTDCEMLEEFPQGSGIGNAVRASWRQFRVKPPRIDGKPQVGAWVRIQVGFYNPNARPY